MAGTIDEETLIILVQEHECLYNLAHKDYDNNLVKDNIWKDIALNLNTTVEVCKKKWTLLRGYYRRALQRRKTKSGQSAKNIKKWRFESQMKFLKPYLQERETQSNLQHSQNSMDEDLEDDREEQHCDYSDSIVETDDGISISSVSSPALSVESRPSCSKESTSFRKSKTRPLCASNTSSKYLKRQLQDEGDNLSATLSNYIKFKQSESSQKLVQTAPVLSVKKRNLLNFFDDIAETILSFPELEQAEIKRDIFSIVNNKQIALLRRAREPQLQGSQNSYYEHQLSTYTNFISSAAQAQSVYHEESHENTDSYHS